MRKQAIPYETWHQRSAEQIARELLTIIPRLNRIIARELRDEFGDDTTIVQMRVLGGTFR